jgi:hypothetical protein
MGDDRQGVATGLTRGEVAKVLGVHVSSVRRYEARGWLRPTGGKGEERTFDEAEVKAFARARGGTKPAADTGRGAGAADAAAFRLFAAGYAPDAVVIKLELPAERVRRLFDLWRTDAESVATTAGEDAGEEPADDESAFRAWKAAMAEAYAAPGAEGPVPRTRAAPKRIKDRRL